jgi:hypothetical protein
MKPVGKVDRQRMALYAKELIAGMELPLLRLQVSMLEQMVPRRWNRMTLWDFEQVPRRRSRQTSSGRAAAAAVRDAAATEKRQAIERLHRRDPGLTRSEIARRVSVELDRPVSRQYVGQILADRG